MRYLPLLTALLLAFAGCDDDSKTRSDMSTQDLSAPAGDASVVNDLSHGPDLAGCVTLTVKNFQSWCNVSVNGGAESPDAVQTVCVAPGTINLAAKALSGFKLDATMWHHTTNDSGSGEAGMVSGDTSSAKVLVGSSATCAWVCCPFTNGSGCNVPDQCP